MAFIMAYHTILFIINLQLVKHLLEQRLMVKGITIHINSRQFKEKKAVMVIMIITCQAFSFIIITLDLYFATNS